MIHFTVNFFLFFAAAVVVGFFFFFRAISLRRCSVFARVCMIILSLFMKMCYFTDYWEKLLWLLWIFCWFYVFYGICFPFLLQKIILLFGIKSAKLLPSLLRSLGSSLKNCVCFNQLWLRVEILLFNVVKSNHRREFCWTNLNVKIYLWVLVIDDHFLEPKMLLKKS